MKTEKEKMILEMLYDATDIELSKDRKNARLKMLIINNLDENKKDERQRILKELLPHAADDFWIEPPFYCDYGYNIILGNKVYMNFNCVILDVCEVKIGERTLLGPNVQIYTATHPIKASERAKGLESGKAIHIGSDVWIGGQTVVCPGVAIGDRSVIGAGSVVTKNIPSDVFAAGNPCSVIKQLN